MVEVDPEIETAVSSVMPGVTWKTWTPFFMVESDNLIDAWVGRVRKHLEELSEDRISSQTLRKAVHAESVAPTNWTKVIQKIALLPKKGNMGKGQCFAWKIEGRSLVRQTAESYGFTEHAV